MKVLLFLLVILTISTAAAAYEPAESRIGKTYWFSSDGGETVAKKKEIVAGTYFELPPGSSIKIVSIEKDDRYKTEDMYRVALSNGEHGFVTVRLFEASQRGGSIVSYDPRKKEASRIAAIKSKKWPAKIEQAAIEQSVILGMTSDQVLLALGKPEKINRTVYPRGVHEQWVYPGGYLYLDNGTVTSYQDSR
jgi:hypothetical protein